jgi:hypothetical protein
MAKKRWDISRIPPLAPPHEYSKIFISLSLLNQIAAKLEDLNRIFMPILIVPRAKYLHVYKLQRSLSGKKAKSPLPAHYLPTPGGKN